MVIAPTRAACETIELALHARVDTLLKREHGLELRDWARRGFGFGIVAGTGTGKTLAIRMIAEEILKTNLVVGVVNREREATAATARCNVVVVTTGIARHWLTDEIIRPGDTIVVDEIHQTSAELELCLALGKRAGCRFIWLSATVDPTIYREYLGSDEVLVTSAFDPALKARVETVASKPEHYLDDRTILRYIRNKRGVAVFLPTRAEVERLGMEVGDGFPRLNAAFYHGGEPIRVIRPFLEGEVAKPWLLAMTAAGQSAINVPGLDTVVILDARYANVVERGRNVLHRLHLGANEILQMAGRVHGRVPDGEVVILTDRRLDFESLRPGPPEFQLAGDAERVAITCAGIGVDARDLDLPVPLDRKAYVAAVEMLSNRGLIENGRLTDYGRDVEALPVERPWAELLVHAGDDVVPLVAGASGIGSLHRMTRDERDLSGALVPGSDHLTAYNLLAEAVNRFGTPAVVHGLRRHRFDEEALAEWAERRGVLVKAIEDGALGLAAVYRSLDLQLPDSLPHADRKLSEVFIELVARIQPFDMVLDEETVAGESARISKTSVAGSWGGIAGSLRWFADRSGTARAGIEGTTIPYQLIKRNAVEGPPHPALIGKGKRQRLVLERRLMYFGFALDSNIEPLDGEIPAAHLGRARRLLAEALVRGELEHPDRGRVSQAVTRLQEYWRRSGAALEAASEQALIELVEAQLGDVGSWNELQHTRISIDVDAIVPEVARRHLDGLPNGIHILGDMVPLEYIIQQGESMVRVHLRMGQARRLRKRDLPEFDRKALLTVRRGNQQLEAATPERLRELLDQRPARESRAARQRGTDRRKAGEHRSRGHGGGRGKGKEKRKGRGSKRDGSRGGRGGKGGGGRRGR